MLPRVARGEHLASRVAHGTEVRAQVAQEDRLDDERSEAAALGLERCEDRAIDGGGLAAQIRDVAGGWQCTDEFPRIRAVHATQRDRAIVCVDGSGHGVRAAVRGRARPGMCSRVAIRG